MATEASAYGTRAEHLRWCKDRALQYIDAGDTIGAMASMVSDMRKHPETTEHAGIDLMMMLAMSGKLGRPGELRDFIEGFN